MENHIKIIGILWIVSGILGLLLAFFLLATLFGVSYLPDIGYESPIILRTVALGTGALISILSLPDLIAGIGLLKKKEWGRIFTIVVAFLNLVCFPFGTALSIYSLVILFNNEAAQLFKK